MTLLLDFPPVFYDTLWQHITLHNPANAFNNLAQLINLGFFNPEQKQTLAQALIKHYQRFNTERSILFWALAIKDPLFLKEILSSYPEQDRLTAVQVKNNNGNTLLYVAANNPESLKVILALYPEQDRLAAIQVKDNYGRTLLHVAANNPESLKVILALYPKQDRLAAVQVKNDYGDTLLHDAANNPEYLKAILDLLPEQDRLAAVQVKNNKVKTPLHVAANKPESLKVILDLLPEQDRLAAVQVKDINGNTLLHDATNNPKSLKVIRESLSKEQLLYLDIKNAMNKACTDYLLHYDNREDIHYQRGYQSGFFSSERQEEIGKTHANEFNLSIQDATSCEVIINLIDTLLTKSNTRYNTHSLASYILDEIHALKKNQGVQTVKPTHYSVELWLEAKQSLQNIASNESIDLPKSHSQII
ncbi:MAG: hypothetical protein H0U57_06740 [Tatlockia sp.]|nr:hypothetical protein [Tatlockia sp.]